MAANAFDACVDHRSPFETIQWPQTHSVLPAVAPAVASPFEAIQWPRTHTVAHKKAQPSLFCFLYLPFSATKHLI